MKNFIKTDVIYWSPSLDKVGTINAVINSALGLKRYSKKFNPLIIDASGEWDYYDKKKIKILKLYKKKYFNILPKGGFFKSRISYLIIFFLSFFPLLRILKKRSPKFLIAHLITSLPFILILLFNVDTKVILRISGLPKINILRRFLWKIIDKKLFLITCPTKSTLDYLVKNKIFSKKKLILLPDPFIDKKEIKKKLKKKKNKIFKRPYFLSIGRLTKQKNFSLLIEAFEIIEKKFYNINLKIIGEGEERKKLQKIIFEKNLSKKIKLLGYKKNIYNYLYNSKCLLLTSLWEDPGAVLLEAGSIKKNVISSNCYNGPKEILDNGKNGILFKNNDKSDLIKKLILFNKLDNKKKNMMSKNLKIKSNFFTIESHTKLLLKILNEN